ncbi:MAG: DUF1211 domain-containing protein [Chthoniobacterales bacterium]|nr:DUF1211 domain-containing protein [Chthoniobacterales bacterium]
MRLNPAATDREVTRLEGFSDAVFGFALALLVVSVEVPGTYAELIDTMRGFGAFACCFAIISWIWYEHNLFFRRYGLQDGLTTFLNIILLFVVLFYVYPLKFIFTMLLGDIFGATRPAGAATFVNGATLMLIYSAAVLVLFLIFALLYWHALRRKESLQLDALGLYDARTGVWRHLLTAGVAVASITIALVVPRHSQWAGIIYSLLGPLHAGFGFARDKHRQRFAKS